MATDSNIDQGSEPSWRIGCTGTDGSAFTISASSCGMLFGSVMSATMNRASLARVPTVSRMVRLAGLSKSNRIGSRPCWRSSARTASSTALRSGVKRPRISTALAVTVSMTARIFWLFRSRWMNCATSRSSTVTTGSSAGG
jgi:hypothetical protein